MEQVKVYIELCDPSAVLPSYAYEGDAGMDIHALEDVEINPNATVIARTGIKVAIPQGYEIQIRPRSGLSLKSPLRIANSPGTIDAGYRDEVGVIIHNSSTTETLGIKKGDRIAQMVLQQVPKIKWQLTDNIEAMGTNRGGGFGSSGR